MGSHADRGNVDIAVSLVESYLRFNGYLTLSEFEVQARNEHGEFESVTDVDIMGIRFPGDVFAGDPHGGIEARMLVIEDPALQLVPDQIDVIIGEVKQGPVDFNPGLRRHVVLHSVLRRVEWLFDGDVGAMVDEVAGQGMCMATARGGGQIRVRLVAFGQSDITDLHTIGHRHIVVTMQRFLSGLDDAFRPVQFREPAPAMLNLLLKSGFEFTAPGE
jgi:hypothetical protein